MGCISLPTEGDVRLNGDRMAPGSFNDFVLVFTTLLLEKCHGRHAYDSQTELLGDFNTQVDFTTTGYNGIFSILIFVNDVATILACSQWA